MLKEALKKDKENVRLQLQLLEVETTNDVVNESRVLKIFDALIRNEKNDDRKFQFSQVRQARRKLGRRHPRQRRRRSTHLITLMPVSPT